MLVLCLPLRDLLSLSLQLFGHQLALLRRTVERVLGVSFARLLHRTTPWPQLLEIDLIELLVGCGHAVVPRITVGQQPFHVRFGNTDQAMAFLWPIRLSRAPLHPFMLGPYELEGLEQKQCCIWGKGSSRASYEHERG